MGFPSLGENFLNKCLTSAPGASTAVGNGTSGGSGGGGGYTLCNEKRKNSNWNYICINHDDT